MARYGLVPLMMVLAPVTRTTAQNTTARLFHHFTVVPNITYLTASNYESKLDLYVRLCHGGVFIAVVTVRLNARKERPDGSQA